MKTILVTGGAGFIGSSFVRHLFARDDCRILVLDILSYAGRLDNIPPEIQASDRFEFWYGNILNADIVHELVGRSDVVVHFAAETHVARSLFQNRVFFETDVLGTQTIANAVLRFQDRIERFVHISTSEVYGSAAYEPMDEEHPLLPTSPYAAAKAGADRLVYAYHRTYGVPAVMVRPFNTYGPRQHLEKVIPRFITSVLLGEPLTVHGDGSAERDFIYVEDVCRGVEAVMDAPLEKVRGEVFNLGTGRCVSIREIAATVKRLMDREDHPVETITNRLGQVDKHIASAEKIRRALAFAPATAFEDGLRETIDWYRANRPSWEGMLYMRSVPVKTRDGRTVRW